MKEHEHFNDDKYDFYFIVHKLAWCNNKSVPMQFTKKTHR